MIAWLRRRLSRRELKAEELQRLPANAEAAGGLAARDAADGLAACDAVADGTAADEAAGRASAWRTVERLCFAAVWMLIAGLIWLVISRLTRITVASHVTVLLQNLTPLVFLPLYPLLALAMVRKRWPQSAAMVVLIVVHIAAVMPAVGSRALPDWAPAAPSVRVFSDNVYDANPTMQAAAAAIVRQDADVLVLAEVSRSFLAALVTAGVDARFPNQQLGSFGRRTGNIEAIFSRLPLQDTTMLTIEQQSFPSAIVRLDGTSVQVVAVHILDPLRNAQESTKELQALRRLAIATQGPLIMAGDFNSTRWSPPFGDLLGSGLHDASESRGQGLTFSWPVGRLLPFPVMRLDHFLGNSKVAASSVADVTVPGSDHRALLVTAAVKA